MAGIKKETHREFTLNIPLNTVVTISQEFDNTHPSVFQLHNFNTIDPIYVSTKFNVSPTFYDVSIVAGATGVYTHPKGTDHLYIYCASQCTVQVNSYESDGMTPIDLNQTQTSVIINSTTTSSVNVAAMVPIPTGANHIGTIGVDSIATGSNHIGSVAIDTAIPAGSNHLGGINIDNSIPAGSNHIGGINIDNSLPTGANVIGKVDLNNLNGIVTNATTATIGNVTCTNANQEYSYTLPANTKRFNLSIQSWNNTTTISVYFSSGAVNVMKILGYMSYSEDKLNLASQTIYFKSSNAGEVVQILSWS